MNAEVQTVHEKHEDQLGLPFGHSHEALETLCDGNEPPQRLLRFVITYPCRPTAELSRRCKVRSVEQVIAMLNQSDLMPLGLQIHVVPHGGGLHGWSLGQA